MEFRLLGPVEARSDGRRLDLGHLRERLLLAVLLVAGGHAVSTERLIDRMWDENPPGTCRDLVHSYLNKLRRHVGGDGGMLPRHDGGYRAVVDRRQVDLHRFHDLVESARELDRNAGREAGIEAVRLYRAALAQWPAEAVGTQGGEPLAGLPGRWAANYRHTLREEHRSTLIACLGAELRCGEHDRLIPELAHLVGVDPPDEQIACMLMLAYYRAGRRAEALQTYQIVRQRLVDEIGSDPGPGLVRLHQQILDEDDALHLPPDQTGANMTTPDDHAGDNGTETLAADAVRLIAEAVRAGRTGEAGSGPRSELVERVRVRLSDDRADEAALAWVERNPGDSEMLERLRRVIMAYLVRDDSFAVEVRRLVRPEPKAESTGRGVTINAKTIKNAQVFNEKVEVTGDLRIGNS
ncbi:AfsR/SARP family transcriptional regulator [Actinomadura craniellae]|uniref:AfsR/SARP family transcriptional regulator n=1 Tax=Actinomadura craniellae TaxID=2231787 RepID=UPI0013140F56|nr:BTAD domain-containing putative transcriptional regulator [Actinomadura craniellae]